MKYIFTAIAIIAGVLSVQAQECGSVLTGKVVDFHNGDPLIYANIQIIGTDRATYSDFEGNFEIDKLCDGTTIELKITHPECQDLIYPILIEGDTYQKIRLEHHLEELGEVNLTGRQLLEKTKTSQEQTLNSEAIERYSSATLGDALKEISGVSSLNTGNSIVKPVIQGLHSSRVLMMNNGVRMEDQEWGVEHAPNIDLNTAGNITVVKGASALQYGGDAIGGVVIVEPEKIPVKDTLYGKTILSGSTNGRGGAISTSLTKSYNNGWYAKVQGTFKKFGDFEAPDYMLSNTGTEEKDFSVNFGLNKFSYGFDAYYSYYNNELGILRASHIGNVSDLVRSINRREPYAIDDFSYDIGLPKQEVEHHLARLKFFQRYEGLGKWNIQYDYQLNNRFEYDMRVGEDAGKASVDLELQTHRLSTNFSFDAQNDYQLNVGLTGSYQNNFPNPATEVRRLIPDYDQYQLGVFALAEYSFNNDWMVEAGARYDYTHLDAEKYYLTTRWNERSYDKDFADIIIKDRGTQYFTNPVFDFHNVSVTGGFNYSFNSFYKLRFNYAMANRAPNPSELFSDGLHHSAAIIELGDLRFDSETSNKLSLGFSKNSGDFTFNLAPYYNLLNNFIILQPIGTESTIRGAFPVWEYQQVNAKMIGVDVDAHYQINNEFSYQSRFAYVYGKNTDTEEYLIDIPPANFSNSIQFSKNKWHHLRLSLTGNFVFEQNEYPDNNFYTDILENGEYLNTLVDISTPPEEYFLLGFDASTTFYPFEKGALEVGFFISNLLNTSYRDYLNRQRYYAENIGRNFTLQVKFNY